MRHYGHIQAYQNLGNIQLLSRRHERLEEKGVAGMQTRGEARRPYFSCPQFTIRSEERQQRQETTLPTAPVAAAARPGSPADASRAAKSNECWRKEID